MRLSTLEWLRCPFCGDRLEVDPGAAHDREELDSGLLSCRCDVHPVVAGIPVLTRGETVPGKREATRQVREGRPLSALLALIEPPVPSLAHRWIRKLPDLPGLAWLRRAAHRRELARLADALRERNAKQAELSALDLLWLYFRHTRENYNYLSLRFGGPRHLVALSFATLVSADTANERPVLDVGCGCGHVTFGLLHQAAGRAVVGIDTFFFGLFLAKEWIAPGAELVCCAADRPLPFVDGCFGTAFSSDSFHYFVDKEAAVREMCRVTGDDGAILACGMHNAQVARNLAYGLPLTPDGYRNLFAGQPCRVTSDREVLDRYLRKLGPALAEDGPGELLAEAPLLSLAVSRRQGLLVDHGEFPDWPHAKGKPVLNLLYQRGEPTHAGVSLTRVFPSAAYERDQPESKRYLPETAVLSHRAAEDLAAGRRSAELEPLVARCVIVGVPDRYLPALPGLPALPDHRP